MKNNEVKTKEVLIKVYVQSQKAKVIFLIQQKEYIILPRLTVVFLHRDRWFEPQSALLF